MLAVVVLASVLYFVLFITWTSFVGLAGIWLPVTIWLIQAASFIGRILIVIGFTQWSSCLTAIFALITWPLTERAVHSWTVVVETKNPLILSAGISYICVDQAQLLLSPPDTSSFECTWCIWIRLLFTSLILAASTLVMTAVQLLAPTASPPTYCFLLCSTFR